MSIAPLIDVGEPTETGEEHGRWWRRLDVVLLVLVVAAAVAHRLYIGVSSDFPINDGGLFVPYIEASTRSFPGLPETVSYNGLELPFAYPPLGFWLGGLLGTLGLGPVGVMQVLPVLLNALWIVLLALLFLRDGHSRLFTAAAVAVLAVAFRSYEWLVMGGGLTRGFGAVFLVLALLVLGGTRGREASPLSNRAAVLGGLCVAGAILSHLEWGVLAAASLVLQRALRSRSVESFLVTTVVAGGTAVLCVAPWFLLVVSRHGLDPFLAAAGTSNWDLPVTVARLEDFARAQWPNLLLAVGGVVLLARRHLFWPVFILLCVVLTPRHSFTPLVVPVSYIAVCGAEAVVGAARRAVSQWRELPETAAVVALGVVAIALSAVAVDRASAVNPSFGPLSKDVRAAMGWVRAEQSGSAFVVVTDPVWYYDATAEWFPALSGATNSTTVQGTEWLPGDAFLQRERDVTAIKVSSSCEELVQRALGLQPVQFVWAQSRFECFETPAFRRVFTNPDVSIFAVA